MNKKRAIEKTVSMDNYLVSIDGDLIFDLMQNTTRDNGYGQKLPYWGASGNVFYTKDEALKKEAKEVSFSGDIEKVKEFLINNKDNIHELDVLKQNGLKIMNDKQIKSFKHLSTSELAKDTLKNGHYGCAHLIEDNKVLIFFQNQLPIREYFEKNLTIPKYYREAQEALVKAYKANKVKPECELTDGALDKVMNSLLDIHFNKLSQNQKDMVLLLQEFNNNVLTNSSFNTEIVDLKHIATFKKGSNTINIEIPTNKGEEFVIDYNKKETKVTKISELLSFVNNELAQQDVNNFLKKRKI